MVYLYPYLGHSILERIHVCVSFPTPPEFRGTGRPPGPVKLFFGGIAFLLVLLFAYLTSLSRAGRDA